MLDNMTRLEWIVDGLLEAVRVDVEEWGGHPTFHVRGAKNFVFADAVAENPSVKLSVAEAAAAWRPTTRYHPRATDHQGFRPPGARP